MQKKVKSRMFFILVSLCLYFCTKRHILMLTNFIICMQSMFFLLQEFKDMFFKDVPSGLPLIRRIEHQIDLTLRATIPNNHP